MYIYIYVYIRGNIFIYILHVCIHTCFVMLVEVLPSKDVMRWSLTYPIIKVIK